MSGQDIGFFDTGNDCVDIEIENGDLKADNSLETAVLISLFSDRFVEKEDLPEGANSQRGWWADLISTPSNDLIGSNLWTNDRAKITADTEARIEDGVKEALQWLIDDGIAQSVAVEATQIDNETVDFVATITKPSGDNIPFKFLWDGQELRRVEVN